MYTESYRVGLLISAMGFWVVAIQIDTDSRINK